MRGGRRRTGVFVGLGVVAALLIVAVVAIYTPRVADHFGYVTPLTGRLPARISYAGRRYAASGGCRSESDLRQFALWPLARGGGVPILFGGSKPLLTPPASAGLIHMTLVVASGSCYQVYTIEGGP